MMTKPAASARSICSRRNALVTYAFEAAAEHPDTLAEVAAGAMWRAGEVAAELDV